MNVKRCAKGHYYDADMHSTCPQCANSIENMRVDGSMNIQGNGSDDYSPTEPVPMSSGEGTFQNDNSYEAGAYGSDKGFSENPSGGFGETVPGFGTRMDSDFGNIVEDYEIQTEAAGINNIAGFTPITGWLVCIEGPERGRDYRIKPGNNYIGRSERMDICLRGDNKISRDRHAMIAYDDVEKIFFFGPVLGQSVVRVNNKLVMSQVELKAYDVISIASTKLIFIPLCGDRFDWEDEA